jgi:cytoskeletal protein CcmA (bactofilin family)
MRILKRSSKGPEPIDISNVREVTSIVGPGTEMTGNLSADTTLRIDGYFNGEVKSTDTVIVGEKGRIIGKVTCSFLFVGGTIEGTVVTSEKLQITAGGYINGDITTATLVIDQGASFDGYCKMKTPIIAVKAEA